MKHRGDLIDGRFVRARGDGDGALEARDADSGEVFASYPIRRESVHEALEAARRAAPRWGESDAEQRAAGFKRLEAQLRNRADELARAITREVGLPAWEAHAEVAQALGRAAVEASA
ncbi:MAG: aldehyde dehydrogenase, partial [Myxococcales bacterium]|nr:aldehyde dehydrogenase [Myxococcales bacterium]